MALRLLCGVLIGVVVLYGVLVVAAFLGQRALLFPAPRGRALSAPGAVIRLPLAGPGGGETLGLWLRGPAAATVVYFHGNGEQLADAAYLARLLHREGLSVLAVEYPGYGLAAGAPTEASLYAAGEAALAHVTSVLGVPAAQIVLLGQSLGTGVAAELALRGRGARLVLLSPYTGIPDLAAVLLPFLPARALVRDRLETARKAARIHVPVLIIHGGNDEVIPVAMGRTLAGLFPHATLQVIEGANHNDLWEWPLQPTLAARIAAFATAP